ncbi:oxidase [Actinoplanes sp. TBRC 11911]|nr:oxidase [Actinoplanes sp. TBRC 11911]
MPNRAFLRALPVFAGALPVFDPDTAADRPDTQFLIWLAAAIEAGVREPHAMTLSTVDPTGRLSARTVILKNVDKSGWQFAGRRGELAAATLTFYWPDQGRQVRVAGPVRAESAELSAADFLARPPSVRSEALTGRSRTTPEQIPYATTGTQVPKEWTLYTVLADEIEFFQGDPDRRHVRLRYVRHGEAWKRGML